MLIHINFLSLKGQLTLLKAWIFGLEVQYNHRWNECATCHLESEKEGFTMW